MEKQLLNQCLSGDIKGVKSLLKRGFSPNLVTNKGETVLIAVCNILLETLEVKPLYTTNYYSQLYGLQNAKEISTTKLKTVIGLLLKYGGRADYCNRQGKNALHMCSLAADLNLVKLCVECGVNIQLLDTVNHNSVLHSTLEQSGKDPSDVVQYLLAQGVCPNAVNKYGRSALHYAAQYRHCYSLRIFLEKHVSVNLQCNDGNTPLMWLMSTYEMQYNSHLYPNLENTFEATIDLLLKARTKTLLQNRKGKTVFHYSVESQNVKLWKKLVQHEKNSANNVCDYNGNSPLHICIIKGAYKFSRGTATWSSLEKMAIAVIRSGARLHLPNKNSTTPMCILIAMEFGKRQDKSRVIQMFLAAGLNILKLPDGTRNRLKHFLFNQEDCGNINILFHVFGIKYSKMALKPSESDIDSEVRSLQNLSAEVIRKQLFPNALKGIEELSVPITLKNIIIPLNIL